MHVFTLMLTLAAVAEQPDVSALVERIAHELVCDCGVCGREPLDSCRCSTAAARRAQIKSMVERADLSSPESMERAYSTVLAAYLAEHGKDALMRQESRFKNSNIHLVYMAIAFSAPMGLLLWSEIRRRRKARARRSARRR